MDILDKIDMMTEEGIVASDIETNLAKGHVDVIGGKRKKETCPDGHKWCSKKKKCVLEEE